MGATRFAFTTCSAFLILSAGAALAGRGSAGSGPGGSTEGGGAPQPSTDLIDATLEAGVDTTVYGGSGLATFGMDVMFAGGAAGDFNRDGWQDLFILCGASGPDRLFINNGDGSFTDRAAEWGVALHHVGAGAAVGDYDNDGWLDVFITSFGPVESAPILGRHLLYRNTGAGQFVDMAQPAGVEVLMSSGDPNLPDGFGSAFGDYDLDGDLDLFVCGYTTASRFFRNNGDGTFTDVTTPAGIVNDRFRGFAPRFVDMNNDLYPELLVSADFRTSRYYVNNRDGTFTNYTATAGTGLDENGMGQTVADFNGDGLLDWFVTSIFGSELVRTGNKLYINQGNHTYTEVAAAAGVANGFWGWGAAAIDLNHDGLVDIVHTNGFDRSLPQYYIDPSRVFLNNGDGTFRDAAMEVGLQHTASGKGLIHVDVNNDGAQDVVILSYNDEMKLFLNNPPDTDANWMRVFLDTSHVKGLAPDGFGAMVYATVDGVTQMRPIDGGCNYLSQGELAAHFGFGAATVIDELRVRWPNGDETVIPAVPANRMLTIIAGVTPIPGDIDLDNRVDTTDLSSLLSRWGTSDPRTDVTGDGVVNSSDLARLLASWGT